MVPGCFGNINMESALCFGNFNKCYVAGRMRCQWVVDDRRQVLSCGDKSLSDKQSFERKGAQASPDFLEFDSPEADLTKIGANLDRWHAFAAERLLIGQALRKWGVRGSTA